MYTKYTILVYMNNEETIQIQSKIDRSAKTLLFSYGVKGWNMDDCAREAGITKRTLYRYVKSKDRLITSVLISEIKETQNTLIYALSNEDDFLKGIEKMLKIYPPMIIKMNSRVVGDVLRIYPEIEGKLIESREELAQEALLFIKKGQAEGFVKKEIDPRIVLEVMQAQILYSVKNYPENSEEKLRESFFMILYGFLKGGENGSRDLL